MAKTITLSSGRSYQAVLIVKRDTMNPSAWVGVWVDPEGDGYVGTEGECSRQYFRTAQSACFNLSRRYSIPQCQIPVMRGHQWNESVVQRGWRMQYAPVVALK